MLIHRHNYNSDTSRPFMPSVPNLKRNIMVPQLESKWQKRLEGLVHKAAIPLNSLATGRGCESFVPMSMKEECAKAARILRSFAYHPSFSDISSKSHLITIPPSSIASAVGVVVFTTGRLGLSRLSGSAGSGLLITRQDQAQDNDAPAAGWNYPLAIQTHGVGLGPLALGFDVSDRVYLIRSRETLDKIMNKGRFMVGPEVVLAVGKWGGGAGLTFSASYHEVRDSVENGKKEVIARTRGLIQKQEAQREYRGCEHCQNCHQHGEGEITQDGKSDEPIKAADEKPPLINIVQQPVEPADIPTASQTQTAQGRGKTSGQAAHPPIQCYMRSHGLYAGLQAEGTVFSERRINGEFYSSPQLDDTLGWGSRPEMKEIEEVWNALTELQFGLQE
ncbi:hypothetical protein V8F33_003396 [Rhypophila sp. PSN 637]